RARAGAQAVRSEESTDLKWWPVDSLPAAAEVDTINHLVELANQR
ncbi:MAG: NUDIX hydrolase, partial [Rhodococcus sp. (in: high G+C Gram-positive bacteria)]